jgi:hypothetical protein
MGAQVVHIGDQLEMVQQRRLRAAEAKCGRGIPPFFNFPRGGSVHSSHAALMILFSRELMAHFAAFDKDDEKSLLPPFTSDGDIGKQAEMIQKLISISGELVWSRVS